MNTIVINLFGEQKYLCNGYYSAIYPLVADCLIDAEHHDLFSTWAEIYAPKGIRIVANVDKVGSSVGVTSEYDNEFYIVI